MEKKKKKKKKEKKPRTDRSEKKKKKNRTAKKKVKKKRSKVAADTICGSPFVCLITILPLSYELWKLKTAKMCFQFL